LSFWYKTFWYKNGKPKVADQARVYESPASVLFEVPSFVSCEPTARPDQAAMQAKPANPGLLLARKPKKPRKPRNPRYPFLFEYTGTLTFDFSKGIRTNREASDSKERYASIVR
jgi:hypothetical protein